MFKRIFSKKSGFTLVEIVIAFAVFAIMAAMIAQILNMVSVRKSDNAKFLATLEEQEEKLAADGKKDFVGTDGTVSLTFSGSSTPKTIDYDMRAANGDEEGVGDGLVYFVSKQSEEALSQPSEQGQGGEQGQLSAVDARITGSPKFDYIKVHEVTKATDYDGSGVCYYLKLSAAASQMSAAEAQYAQFKLNFFSSQPFNATREYEDENKKVYTRQEYPEADIIDAGYINTSVGSFSWDKHQSVVTERTVSSSNTTVNPFYVARTAPNTLRISAPYASGSSLQRFVGKYIWIYVVFNEDPELTVDSFGYNGSGGKYEPCPVYKETYDSNGNCLYEKDGDKTSNYIYGAYMYKRNYK